MKSASIHSKLHAKWHAFLCLLILALVPVVHGQTPPPDLTAGDLPTGSTTITFGPTGLRGWVYSTGGASTDGRQLLVKEVAPGSPADGVLQVGDVILGADGTGAVPANFTEDARKSFAYAIADAEALNPATLKLLIWRAGTTQTVQITLQTMGAYSATAPYNCPKSALILEQGLQYVMDHENEGKWGLGTLPLIAGNDPSNPNNAARQARVQADIAAMISSPEEMALMNSDEVEDWSTKLPWRRGHELIVLCEYYLKTGDTSVLPDIDAHVNTIAKGQSLFGTVGHSFASKNPDGTFNGSYAIGYGPVNSAGVPCFYGLVLAKQCGNTNPKLDAAIERAERFFGSYAGKGTIPYGEHGPGTGYTSNGKSGLAALAFEKLNDGAYVSKFFAQMATAGASNREGGHTGYYFNALWTPLGAAVGGDEAAAYHFSQISWHLDLSRRWDGGFDFSDLGSSGTIWNSGFKMFVPALLTYALPLRQIAITGQGRNPAGCMSSAEVDSSEAAEHYQPETRTTSELMDDLGSWAPEVRRAAVSELRLRTSETAALIPTLQAMASDPNGGYSRNGACIALGAIRDASSLTVLAGLLTDPDLEVRRSAALALQNFPPADTLTILDTILNAAITTARPLLPLNADDPLQFAHAELSDLLFGHGNGAPEPGALYSSIDGVDRNLLYPAVRALAATPFSKGRAPLGRFFNLMTEEDFAALADIVLDLAQYAAPANNMAASVIRFSALDALKDRGIAEGVPLAMLLRNEDDSGVTDSIVLPKLEAYGASALAIQPDPHVMEFLNSLVNENKAIVLSGDTPALAQAIIDAILADEGAPAPPALKSIQAVTADAPPLTLPTDQTTLRVSASDIAQGDSLFTWRKLRGAGEVTFTPNGTSAAQDTVVLFDGTPGNYLFEVTMSDSRGLTEVSGTVEVTLLDSAGNLPPNSPPTANPQTITATRQPAPVPITLTGSDPENLPLSFRIVQSCAQGWLSGTPPNLLYTPNATNSGNIDSFVFEVTDSEGQTDQETVTIALNNSFANIVWVSPARDGGVPPLWNTALTAAGYTVTGFIGQTTPTPAEQAYLNAASLIICESGGESTVQYPAGTAAIWNRLQAPLIQMDAAFLDDWGLVSWDKSGLTGATTFQPAVQVSTDPIWDGVTLPLDQALCTRMGVRKTEILKHGGVRIAGDAGQTAIARWAAGAIPTGTYGGGERLFFAGSTQEDEYALTPLGETAFLNAVADMFDASARTSAPRILGYTQTEAEAAIVAAQLVVGTITTVWSDTMPAGMIISQSVAARSIQLQGSSVDLVISLGPEPRTLVPDVTALAQASAEATLTTEQLTVGTVSEEFSETAPIGSVISQSISPGISVVVGTAVDLVVSLGSIYGAPTELIVLPSTGNANINWTNVGGIGSPNAERIEAHIMDGSGISTNTSGKLVHSNVQSTMSTHHSNLGGQNTAGLLIDLGAEYEIGTMQIWNFNTLNSAYSTTKFDFKYTSDPTAIQLVDGKLEVADLGKFTTVSDDTPLPVSSPFPNPDYLGQTFTFGETVMPAELGDQNGTVDSLSAAPITARYIFLDDMLGGWFGNNPPLPRIGLAEIRIYTYQSTNNPPVFASNPITGTDATEDAAYTASLAPFASDADVDDVLIFSKTSGPAWLQVAPDGTLSGTPGNDDVGLNQFVVRVQDPELTFANTTLRVMVFNSNDPPVFSVDPMTGLDAYASIDYTGTLVGSATDIDVGDSLTYSITSGPGWLSIGPDGSLSGTPGNGDVGLNEFVVSVTDSDLATDDAILRVMVIANNAPVFASDPILPPAVPEDSAYTASLAGSATDEDGDDLTYAKLSGPAWLIVAENGDLSGTPTNSDVGLNVFTVSVTDGIAAPVEAALNITVINTNDAPAWTTSPVAGTNATEDSAYTGTLTNSVIDPDAGAVLTYAKVGGPAWLSVAANGGLSGMPTNSEVGSNVFTVSVSDGIAAPVQATLNITVINTNDAPTWTTDPIAGTDATEDSAYTGTLAGSATDVDTSAVLTYTKAGGPAWLVVATNGNLSGTPTNSDVGSNVFTVSVSDGIAAPLEATLNITVINTNDAPTWTTNPVAGTDATEDSSYTGSLAASATDADTGASLTYAKVGGPAWLIVATNGDLSGTPTNSDVGPNVFTVSVSDGIAAPVQASLNITVVNTNDAPTFAADPIIAVAAADSSAYAQTIASSASDEDGDSLTYAKVSGPAWLSIAPDGTLSGTPGSSNVGANSFTVSVTDGIAPAVNAQLQITVYPFVNWNVNAAGPWSTAGNWNTVTVPGNGAGEIVGLANDISANRAVTLDTTSRTVGTLNIGDTNDTHTFTLAASGGAMLTFDNNGNGASIVETGSVADIISAPLTLADDLTLTPGGSLTISGAIGQTGAARSINMNGSGTLTLSGTNDYAGGFTLTSGIVSAGSSGTYTGFGTGKMTWNGGRITTNNGAAVAIANDFELNGANLEAMTSYGTLTFGGIGTLKQNINFKVATHGTTDTRFVFNNAVGDEGNGFGLSLAAYGGGAGGFTFNAVNTFTGDITIGRASTTNKARTLIIGNNGSLNSGDYSGNINNDNTTGSIIYSSSANQILRGVISGSAKLIKDTSGTSTLTLTGNNSYKAATSVDSGKLFINGDQTSATGAISVADGATLGGTGKLGGNTTIAAGGKLEFNLSTAPGSHDKLDLATGKTLVFSGASTITLTASGTPAIGPYTLVTAPGGITWTTEPTVVLPPGWTYSTITGNGGTNLVIDITAIAVGSPYDTWATANGILGEPFDGDFNSDGITNGVAYALGLSPTASSQPAGVLSGNTITFTKGADAIANDDVTWIIETSETLAAGSWTDAVIQSNTNNDPTIFHTFTPGPGTPKKFARLRVVQAAP